MIHFAKTYFTDTDKLYDIQEDKLLPFFYEKLLTVSEERQKRVERVRDNLTKAELLASELVRDYALKTVFDIEKPNIVIGEQGKPMLSGIEGAYFNVSHSGRMVACTVADVQCGLDIENISYPHDLMRIANRFFSTLEQNAMLMSPNPNEAFCRLWTLRESYVKMRGTGFAMGLKALRCDFHRGKASIIENEILQEDAFFIEFKNIYGYRAAVCTKEPVNHIATRIEIE